MAITKLQPFNLDTTANYTFANINATGIVNFTTSANVTLGAVGNVKLTGGTANYVLQTDGAGNLSWAAQSGGGGGGGNTSNISNGTSNVSIATSDGNVTTSVAGNANIMIVTGTGVNVAGTLNTTGNTTFTGANVNLGAVANLHISGGTANYMLQTDGVGTLTWAAQLKVTSIGYPDNDTAADPAGGQTITLTGSGFVAGASILINSIAVSVVSVVSSTVITFTSPANNSGSYVIYVVNPDGSTAIAVPGIQYSGVPTWTTAAGTLGSLYETASFSQSVTATGDAPIIYSVFSGTLPPGSTFNGNGTITGTSQLTASPTTYTFIVRATDAEQQDTNRSFSLTINTDVVTWTTPADNSTTTLSQNSASTTTLLATSAAGKTITYTANALPTGLSISGATVTGTPTVIGNTTSLFTATAATTGRTTTATINWTISVATDLYFKYNSLLLSAGTFTSTFIADASTNNFPLSIFGDTKPNNFNPYTPGYYSNYFDGSSNFTSSTSQIVPTGSFTVECWVYVTSTSNQAFVAQGTSGNAARFSLAIDANLWWTQIGNASINIGTPIINTWNYIAVTFNGSTLTLYVNGTSIGTVSTSTSAQNTTLVIGTLGPSWAAGYFVTGYISNVRVSSVVRTIVTPTAPYTSDASTRLLTCQSNRFLDNSTNAFALTITGTPAVSPTTPFVPNSTYATYGSTYFDGTGDYLTTPASGAFIMGTNDFTFECWVKPTVITSGNNNILAQWGSGNAFIFRYVAAGRLRFDGAGSSVTGTTTAVTVNQWNHVAITRSSSTVRLFVNGVVDATTGTIGALTEGASVVSIAAYSDGTSEYVTGYISNLRLLNGTALYTTTFTPPTAPLTAITNTVLLTCQTNQPANNSVFLDDSTNAFAITRAGNTTQGTFSPYGANWSNYFDGTGDYMDPTSSSVSLSANWTIEFWFNTAVAGVSLMDSRSDATNGFYPNISGYSATQIDAYYNSTDHLITVGTYLSVWNHVAMVKNSGTLTIYFNGVSVYSVADSNTWLIGANRPRLAANGGYFSVAPGYYTGYISNFRIVNGTAVYTTAFTPSTTPLTAITNTRLLTCQSNRFVDNSTNAYAITRYGDTKVQRFSPFGPTVAYSTSTIGGSGYFDGTGDYLTVATNDAFRVDQGDFTIEGWVYFPGAPTAFALATRGVYVSVYSFYAGNTGAALTSLFWEAGTGAWAATGYTSSAGALVGGQWNHIAYVRSSTSFYMYANGVRVFSQVITTIGTNVTAPLWIGSYYNQNSTLTGNMADFRFVKGTALYTGATYTVPTAPLTAITNTSLLLNYTNAGITDSTMINNLETVGDAKILSTQTPYASTYYSNYFDGSGDYLTVPDNVAFTLSTNDFTFECWVNPTVGTSTTNNIVLSQWGSGNAFIFRYVNGRLKFDGAGSSVTGTTTTVTAGQWNHIAITRSSSTVRLFVNGVIDATTGTIGALTDGASVVAIGAYTAGTSEWVTGYISNLRLLNGTALYTTTFTPPTAPLTAITNTVLLTCQSNRFLDNSTNAFTITRAGDTSVQSFNPFQRNSATTLYFDGTGDGENVSSLSGPLTGNFTYEAWVYPTSSALSYRVIFGLDSYATASTPFRLYQYGTNFQFWYTSTAGNFINSSTITIAGWYHIAITRSGTDIRMFVNGIQAGTTLTSAVNYPSSAFRVGMDSAGTYPFIGYISDLRVTNGVARYTTTFTPPTIAFSII